MRFFKELISIIIFIILMIFTIYSLDRLFIPKWLTNKDNSHTYISRGYYAEKENTLDVLFLGNSDTYRGLSPMIIWEEYGITSYNYVSAGQRMWTGYYMFEESIRTQNPKVIFLNVDSLFSDNHSSISNYQKAFDNMKLSKNKINAIMDESFNFSIGRKINFILPIISYHTRYNELSKEDFINTYNNFHNPYKGLDMITVSVPYEKVNYIYNTEERRPLHPKVKKYLDMVVNRCKEENIELVLFWIPSPDSWRREKTNTILDYAKDNNLKYLDLNLNYKEFGLDFKTDTSDGGDHLNVYGAEKVAHFIGNYIKSNYTFDKHDENTINIWNNDLKDYYKIKKELEISEH